MLSTKFFNKKKVRSVLVAGIAVFYPLLSETDVKTEWIPPIGIPSPPT